MNKNTDVRVDQFKIVIAIGRHKWNYSVSKDGSVSVGTYGAEPDMHIGDKGQQALTVFIEEIRKAMQEAKRRITAGEVPKPDNGAGMLEAAGVRL